MRSPESFIRTPRVPKLDVSKSRRAPSDEDTSSHFVQEERLRLVEVALRMRAAKMKTKSEAAHRRRQKILKERMQRRHLMIERSRLEGLRRLWLKRRQITQSLARPLCAANKLRSSPNFQCVVPAARDGYCPPDPFTALSATHLAYAEARTFTTYNWSFPTCGQRLLQRCATGSQSSTF